MSDAIDDSSSTPGVARSARTARLVRAAALLAVGFAIAFTATLHEQLDFDRWLLSAGLVLIGAATLVEYLLLRDSVESWWVAARATAAFAAAGALVVALDSPTLALIIAAWALLTALITVLRVVRGAQPRGVGAPSALLSVALAVAVLIFRADSVAIIGFFGSYAVIRGVFLGISAFDSGATAPQGRDGRRTAASDPSRIESAP